MADGSLIFDTGVDTAGMKKDLNSVGDVAKGVFAADVVEKFAAAGGKAIAGLAENAVAVGKNFETSMSQVAATMGITSEEIAAGSADFEMLSNAAKEMGATTKYTASEAAEGLNILAMSGLSASESVETLPSVLSLAAAGAMDMGASATYITGAVKGFNDEMSNAGKYADIMAKGATMANTDVNALGEALSGASSNANAYNQSLETTTVALLRLAEQNVTGAEASTAMARAMADLYTPTSEAAATLDKLGIATYDAQGNARDFNTVVDELDAKLSEYNDEQKLAYESTIFTTYGMKAFQKMTVSTTEKVDAFKQGIADASGSAMQQMETQIDNLDGKLAILNSATEAVGITFYEIFEDTLKNSTDRATDAMTRFQKELTSGKLSKSMERLADAVGNFAENSIDAAEEVLPKFIDGLAWIADHGSEILSALEGLGAAWATYEIVVKAAEIQQAILNGTMLANPAVAVTAAIVGLTTAMVAYGVSVGHVETATEIANDRLSELTTSAAEAMDSATNSVNEVNESFSEIAASEEYMRGLADQIEKLNEEEELSASQKARMKALVDQLNDSLGDTVVAIDEEGHVIDNNTGSWKKNFEARLKAAKQNKAIEELTALYDNLSENEIELAKAEQEVLEIQAEREELLEKLAPLEEEFGKLEEDEAVAYYELKKQIEALDQEEAGLVETQDALRASSEEVQGSIEFLSEYVDKEAEAAKEAADATEEFKNKQEEAGATAEETANQIDEAYKDIGEAIHNAIDSQTKTFQDFKDASDVTFDSLSKSLESQIDDLESWSTNIATLADRGINQGLLTELSEMGPEGAGYVAAFVKMTDEELDKINELFEEKAQISSQTETVVQKSWELAGTNMTIALNTAIMQSPEWAKMDANYRQGIVDSLKNSKTEAKKQGKEIDEMLGRGIDENADIPEKSAKNAAELIAAQFESVMDPSNGRRLAEKYVKAISKGLKAGADEIKEGAAAATETIAVVEETPSDSGENFNSFSSANAYAAGASYSGAGQNQKIVNVVNVKLEGDAGKIFDLVRDENQIFYDSTGYSGL